MQGLEFVGFQKLSPWGRVRLERVVGRLLEVQFSTLLEYLEFRVIFGIPAPHFTLWDTKTIIIDFFILLSSIGSLTEKQFPHENTETCGAEHEKKVYQIT